jgi:hypothetical protein
LSCRCTQTTKVTVPSICAALCFWESSIQHAQIVTWKFWWATPYRA